MSLLLFYRFPNILNVKKKVLHIFRVFGKFPVVYLLSLNSRELQNGSVGIKANCDR